MSLCHYWKERPPHLILQVWYQRPFPLPIHCFIPVIWFLGIWVWDVLKVLPVLKQNVPP